MNIESTLALTIAMIILVATPGPGVFATVSRAVNSGFWAGFGVILGILLGDIFFIMLTILGLAFIAQMLGKLFLLVKIFGGLYLIWTGWKMWCSQPEIAVDQNESKAGNIWKNILSGLVITLGNPKAIIFYVGFLPTFMNIENLSSLDIFIVICIISTVLITILVIYAYLASQTSALFQSKHAIKRLNRTAGTVMICTGVAIIKN